MRIDGDTRIIAHIGYPTTTFRSPLIYNPYFARIGVNAAVVPMGVRREHGPQALPAIFRMTNVIGALITMPLKIDVVRMLDSVSTAVTIAGSANAVRIGEGGRLEGDNVDGEGFVQGLARKGCTITGNSALVVGVGGVGSAIAAALAGAGLARLALHDTNTAQMAALADRLRQHYPALILETGSVDPAGFGIAVNATPLGMNVGDPLPLDVTRLSPETFVGEVVLKDEMTPLLKAAAARGCRVQVGLDMLFEMIPAYLTFFGLPTTTPDVLRRIAAQSESNAS
jgi:shikimate dehydrogenase